MDLGRGGRREGDQRRRADLVDDRADAPVLGAEVMAPLRNAVGLVDGIEGDLDPAQEGHVVLLREGFGGEIEQFGLPVEHILPHLLHGRLVEGRIEEVGDPGVVRKGAHRIDLVLHEGDQRRNDDRHALHQQRGQLVAQRLAAARGHQDERILPFEDVADDGLLVSLESREPEVCLQPVMQQGGIESFHRP